MYIYRQSESSPFQLSWRNMKRLPSITCEVDGGGKARWYKQTPHKSTINKYIYILLENSQLILNLWTDFVDLSLVGFEFEFLVFFVFPCRSLWVLSLYMNIWFQNNLWLFWLYLFPCITHSVSAVIAVSTEHWAGLMGIDLIILFAKSEKFEYSIKWNIFTTFRKIFFLLNIKLHKSSEM